MFVDCRYGKVSSISYRTRSMIDRGILTRKPNLRIKGLHEQVSRTSWKINDRPGCFDEKAKPQNTKSARAALQHQLKDQINDGPGVLTRKPNLRIQSLLEHSQEQTSGAHLPSRF